MTVGHPTLLKQLLYFYPGYDSVTWWRRHWIKKVWHIPHWTLRTDAPARSARGGRRCHGNGSIIGLIGCADIIVLLDTPPNHHSWPYMAAILFLPCIWGGKLTGTKWPPPEYHLNMHNNVKLFYYFLLSITVKLAKQKMLKEMFD